MLRSNRLLPLSVIIAVFLLISTVTQNAYADSVADNLATSKITSPPVGKAAGESRRTGMDPVDDRVELREYLFTDTDEMLPYAVFVSSKVKKNKKAPLVLALHGFSGNHGTFMRKQCVEEAEKNGMETEYVSLRNRKMNFCIHCDKCVIEEMDRCAIWEDDMTPLYDKFYGADGYIIGSPVYEYSVNAQLATFFDRFRAVWYVLHQDYKTMYNKVGGAIAVGGSKSGGQEFTIARIHGFYATWGILPINLGSPGFTGSAGWSVDGTYEKLTGDEIAAGEARLLGERVALTVKKMAEE